MSLLVIRDQEANASQLPCRRVGRSWSVFGHGAGWSAQKPSIICTLMLPSWRLLADEVAILRFELGPFQGIDLQEAIEVLLIAPVALEITVK